MSILAGGGMAFQPMSHRQDADATLDLTSLAKATYVNAATSTTEPLALELKDIKAIIDLMQKNDLSVFEMEKDGFRLKLQKGAGDMVAGIPAPIIVSAPAAVPASTATAAETAAAAEKAADAAGLKEIVSPMVGTFYRAGSPDAPPFVDVGKEVNADSVVCIIEAMKVMNEIKAETSGVIAEVVAESGKPVQFGQVLFRVR